MKGKRGSVEVRSGKRGVKQENEEETGRERSGRREVKMFSMSAGPFSL